MKTFDIMQPVVPTIIFAGIDQYDDDEEMHAMRTVLAAADMFSLVCRMRDALYQIMYDNGDVIDRSIPAPELIEEANMLIADITGSRSKLELQKQKLMKQLAEIDAQLTK
jgi:hypothetical protein